MKTVMILVLALLISATIVIQLSYDVSRERLLSRFADSKAEYGMLLSGYAHFQGDTVFFNLLPAVQFPINPNDQDVIMVKTGGKECLFNRQMMSQRAIPNPSGKGKAMKLWTSASAEKTFLTALKKVVKNGVCVYDFGFNTEQALKENFIKTYGLSEKRATHLAALAQRPIPTIF